MRQDGAVEGALQAKHQNGGKGKKKKGKKHSTTNGESTANNNSSSCGGSKKDKFPPCQHCGRGSHPYYKCWRRPDTRCSKCNRLGHEDVICKDKNHQQGAEAQIADQEEEN